MPTRPDFRPGGAGQDVAAITLDDVCREAGIDHIDVMKVDTESTAPAVLRGATDVLARHRPAILREVLMDSRIT